MPTEDLSFQQCTIKSAIDGESPFINFGVFETLPVPFLIKDSPFSIAYRKKTLPVLENWIESNWIENWIEFFFLWKLSCLWDENVHHSLFWWNLNSTEQFSWSSCPIEYQAIFKFDEINKDMLNLSPILRLINSYMFKF